MTTQCGRCGAIVRLDHPACPACGAPRILSPADPAAGTPPLSVRLHTPPSGEKLTHEVSARLMWGEAPEAVRADFLRQGARPVEVDLTLRNAVDRRRAHYRRRGLWNLLAGLALFLIGNFLYLGLRAWSRGEGPSTFSLKVVVLCVICSIAGILLSVRGFRRLTRPGEGERNDTDLEGELENQLWKGS